MRKLLFLNSAQRFGDFALLLLRVFVGSVPHLGRLGQHRQHRAHAANSWHFLAKHDFPSPKILAPVSVYMQFLVGVRLRARTVHALGGHSLRHHVRRRDRHGRRDGGMRGIFPSGCLVVIGLYLATHGAGPLFRRCRDEGQ